MDTQNGIDVAVTEAETEGRSLVPAEPKNYAEALEQTAARIVADPSMLAGVQDGLWKAVGARWGVPVGIVKKDAKATLAKLRETPPSVPYTAAVRQAAQTVFDDPTLIGGDLEGLCKKIASTYKTPIGIVRADANAAFAAIKAVEDASRAAKRGAPITPPEASATLCDEALNILQKWGGSTVEYASADKIPTKLEDFDWPMWGYDGLVPYALAALDTQWALILLGSKVRYANLDCLRRKEPMAFLTPADFKEVLANRLIEYPGKDEESPPKKVPLSQRWREHPERSSYSKTTFCPGCKPGAASDGALNLFCGFGVEPKKGDWSLLRTHILDNVCCGDAYLFRWLMSWMAQLVQTPNEKTGVAVALRGKKGTGKSKLAEWLWRIIGKMHARQVSQPDHITGKFNAHIALCLLLVCNEAFWAGDKKAESVIKAMITDSTVMLEKKGIDALEMDNFTRILITTNDDWVVPATQDERRWLLLDVGDEQKQNAAYFAAIDEQMNNGGAEAMLHDLLEWDYSQPDIDLRNPPKTAGLKTQVTKALDPIPAWYRDMLIEGGFRSRHENEDNFVEMHRMAPTVVVKDLVTESVGRVMGNWKADKLTSNVTEALKKLMPDLRADSKGPSSPGSKYRPPAYTFPPLDQMRASWTKDYGEAPWTEGAPTSGGETELQAMLRRSREASKEVVDGWKAAAMAERIEAGLPLVKT